MKEKKYDCTNDIMEHINGVRNIIKNKVIPILDEKAENHDKTKLQYPEKNMFDEYRPKLKELKYGSDEYKQCIKEMNEKGLNHHYEYNSHHPEHFENGIHGMTLFDIIEMLVDWIDASHVGNDVDKFRENLQINAKRFNISDQLLDVIFNSYMEIISEK